MRDRLGIGVILLALLLAWPVCAAHAGVDDWGWGVGAYSDFQDGGTSGGLGVWPTAVDGWDSEDWTIEPGPKAYFGTYHEKGVDGWTGGTGFYSADYRAPMPLAPGLKQTWTIYVWADPTLSQEARKFVFNCQCGTRPPREIDAWLTLSAKPVGITGGPDVGTRWHLSELEGMGVNLPIFRTADGREGYVFDLTATVIPEPSSLAALGIGLLPLAGVAVRRRKAIEQ